MIRRCMRRGVGIGVRIGVESKVEKEEEEQGTRGCIESCNYIAAGLYIANIKSRTRM